MALSVYAEQFTASHFITVMTVHVVECPGKNVDIKSQSVLSNDC